jgi:hypothetical protein
MKKFIYYQSFIIPMSNSQKPHVGFLKRTYDFIKCYSFKEWFAPPSSANLNSHSKHWDFNPSGLEGKTILNLGAGGDDLQTELSLKGITARVFNVDLKYPRFGKRQYTPPNPIKADMAALPFGEETFDNIFSYDALLRWLPGSKQVGAIEDAFRTLNPRGTMYLYEVRWNGWIPPINVRKTISYFENQYAANIRCEYLKDTKTLKISKIV